MLDTFVFAANAVAPVVLMTALGYILKKIGLCSREFAAQANKLCFRVFLPVMLFINLYDGGGLQKSDLPLAGFSVAAILVVFAVGMLIVRIFTPDRSQKGAVLQCILRSNFAIIGLPLASSLAGDEGARLAAVVAVVAVPTFNVLAVIALTMYRREDSDGKKVTVGSVIKGIVTNPLIIGVISPLVVLGAESLLAKTGINIRLADAQPVYSAMKSLKAVTTPLALIALGAQFEFSAVRSLLKQIIVGTVGRLIIAPAIVIGAAYFLFPQFGAAEFALLVALSASPVAVSSAVMAAEMDADKVLAGQYVVWTTLFSMVTVFFIVVLLRSVGVF